MDIYHIGLRCEGEVGEALQSHPSDGEEFPGEAADEAVVRVEYVAR